MASLYENNLNGILADDMVRIVILKWIIFWVYIFIGNG